MSSLKELVVLHQNRLNQYAKSNFRSVLPLVAFLVWLTIGFPSVAGETSLRRELDSFLHTAASATVLDGGARGQAPSEYHSTPSRLQSVGENSEKNKVSEQVAALERKLQSMQQVLLNSFQKFYCVYALVCVHL